MMNLGLPEIIVIGALALLVFGPKKLPELAKSLGKGLRDFKKALEGGSDSEDEHKAQSPKADSLPPEQTQAKPPEATSSKVAETEKKE